jgi:hypothetical protein
MKSFEEFVQSSVAAAKANYLDPSMDGNMFIHAECEDPKNNTSWILQPEDEKDKQAKLIAIAMAFEFKKVQQYSIASLAWMSEQKIKPGEDLNDIIANHRPSQDPQRVEILIITSIHKDSRKAGTVIKFDRVGDKITYTSEIDMGDKNMEGRLTELLGCLNPNVPEQLLEAATMFADSFAIDRSTTLN